MVWELESVNVFTMARTMVIVVALLVCLVAVHSAPQFGGSFSQANAQAGGFGGPYQQGGFGPGFQRPIGPPGYRPGFGGPGYGRRFNNGGGGSISISKSISISRGGGGAAQSSAQAGSIGK